jgi:hypothetical protein
MYVRIMYEDPTVHEVVEAESFKSAHCPQIVFTSRPNPKLNPILTTPVTGVGASWLGHDSMGLLTELLSMRCEYTLKATVHDSDTCAKTIF